MAQRDSIIDLFSGVGGLSLGAARAGFNVAGAVEIDPHAVKAHASNFPFTKHLDKDVSTLTGADLRDIFGIINGELAGIIGGPPCQGFSVIGKNDIADPRNNLFSDFFRIVSEAKPKFFLAENVPGILTERYENLRQKAFHQVEKDYTLLDPLKICAKDFGVPTIRTRVFFYGFRKDEIETLTADHFLAKDSTVTVKVRDALKGLPLKIKPTWQAEEDGWRIVRTDGKGFFNSRLQGHIPANVGNAAAIQRLKNEGRASGSLGTVHSKKVADRYAFIIEKGFEVHINGQPVVPRPTKLAFASRPSGAIKPFIFKSKLNGVDVFVTVGFTRPIPSQDEINNEQEEKQYSSLDAGWTIVCNDRAVLYCDRSELTGWGEASVPRYHTQFIAISGIVEFKSNDPSKLPTTTTKRGIEASSILYLQVKNKMREGMLIFTDYTNKWKGRADESKKHMDETKPLSLDEIKTESKKLSFNTTKHSVLPGSQFKPNLPLPKKIESKQRRISFLKDADDVRCVADHLFQDESADPSDVGEKCFDLMLKESRK